MKKVKDFTEPPIDCSDSLKDLGAYRRFLRAVLRYADQMILTCDLDREDFADSIWGFLEDSVTDDEYTDETAVTNGPNVMMLYLKIDHVTSRWLRGKKNVYDFLEDDGNDHWLYDLCFAKRGEICFCSCTHEGFAYVSQGLFAVIDDD